MEDAVSGTTVDVPVQVVRVGLLGFGGVGQAVARLATRASGRLGDAGVLVKCIGALARDPGKPRVGPDIPLYTDPDDFPFTDCDIIVEVLGGIEPARNLVARVAARYSRRHLEQVAGGRPRLGPAGLGAPAQDVSLF